MRLLDTGSFDGKRYKMVEFFDENIPTYAILSHRWGKDEVTYQDMTTGDPVAMEGFDKIKRCCKLAKDQDYEYAWVDSCCIDKTSSAELSESINSMFRWYQDADVCYALLSDVSKGGSITESKWFTRGFTLQELIAPLEVVLFDKNWNQIGTKASLKEEISQHTGIPVGVLSGDEGLEDMSVAQRMSWAATRQTSRREDRAYSLLGIFAISMPLLYGEGDVAFIRLQEEIMRVWDDHSIFAWQSTEQNHGGLLATSPDAFKKCTDIKKKEIPAFSIKSSWVLNNKGIQMELPFFARGRNGLGVAILPCVRVGMEDAFIGIYLRDIHLTFERYERAWSGELATVNPADLQPALVCLRHMSVRQDRFFMSKPKGRQRSKAPAIPDFRPTLKNELFSSQTRANRKLLEDSEFPPLSRINTYDENGNPMTDPQRLVIYAAVMGYTDMLWSLMSVNKANADMKNGYKRSPLSYAAEGGHEEIVRLLMSRNDVDPCSIDDKGMTSVSYAAREGRTGVLNILWSNHSVWTQSKDPDGAGKTALVYAIQAKQEAAVEFILTKRQTEINIPGKSGHTTLELAVESRHAGIVKLLLSHGAHPDEMGSRDVTPLWRALRHLDADIVELLLRYGASPNVRNSTNHMPHCHAAKEGRLDIIKVLLSYGAKIESCGGTCTPLSWAANNGHDEVVRFLLSKGANTETSDALGRSPIYWAAKTDNDNIVHMLLENGADIISNQDAGHAVLQWALKNRQDHIVEILRPDTTPPESGISNSRSRSSSGDPPKPRLVWKRAFKKVLPER